MTQPAPDPTVLTTEALTRGLLAERDYVGGQLDVLRERLRGIDTATELLNETVNRTPTAIQREIGHVRELMTERFDSVALQFQERDIRGEREARDNKIAVDAAFAAQEKAAVEQNKSNTLAISKSETATTETINKLAELFKTTTDALGDKVEDLKDRLNEVTRLVSENTANRLGANDAQLNNREGNRTFIAVLTFLLSVVVAAFVIYAATHKA